eukprot:TRINITY_DN1536_c0_g1_i1.p1 TRINITY_DN1536_c0_g1~~TRINITY_DN1536_c0_g1_i1.p1  ORF type:complete len:266 (-),score=53.54 TRINITY_DN1536_c0_g1_i1:156-920(-)
MTRGPKKHLKRLNAPSRWMLDKLSGRYAPRPSPGPHKLRECLPLTILIRNRLKYAMSRKEVQHILMNRLMKVDHKVRTDPTYPLGFMDVVSVDRTDEHYRMLFDVKGRFAVHRITTKEAAYKLCKVRKLAVGQGGIPYIVTHDGRTIRYPDPNIRVNDSVQLNLKKNKITDILKFDVGVMAMITGGHNIGRIGTITNVDKHPGSFTIIRLKDKAGHAFATRLSNVFVIGDNSQALITIPKGGGVKLSLLEQRDQ